MRFEDDNRPRTSRSGGSDGVVQVSPSLPCAPLGSHRRRVGNERTTSDWLIPEPFTRAVTITVFEKNTIFRFRTDTCVSPPPPHEYSYCPDGLRVRDAFYGFVIFHDGRKRLFLQAVGEGSRPRDLDSVIQLPIVIIIIIYYFRRSRLQFPVYVFECSK